MANDVTLSKGVRANLLSLQQTAEMMARTQERLSTGKKVNSALDNPVNYFTAAGLHARAADLGTLLDSIGNGVQTIAAADKGITAITKLVESLKSTAKQAIIAGQPEATYALQIQGSPIPDDASVATGSVGSITGASTLQSLGIANGETITISDGTNTVTHTVVDATTEDVDDVIASLNGGGATWTVAVNGSGNLEVTANSNATTLAISGNGADSVFGTTTGSSLVNSALGALTGTMTVQVGTGAVQTLTFGAGQIETRADLATALSNLTGVTATINGSDEIEITSTSSSSVTIGGTTSLATLGLTAGAVQPTATVSTPNATRASLQSDYNELLQQITQLARDASYNGVNLLNSDNLGVIFNEDGSSSLTINGVDFSAAGLGLTPIAGDGFQIQANVTAAIAQLDAATAQLRAQASAFGSNLSIVQARQDFTKNLINVLQLGGDNLVLADSNEEGANLLALQTRQSLSTTSLSMAAQADQNVLRLFQ
ncbi:MAG TPA: flagellin [Xanthobacteraceae bacterium]|nr:flagellin [Xanthobacteraceae bacterium]